MVDIAKALEQVEFVMEAVTFTEFIYEEALQTAFFALSNTVRAKQYDLAQAIYYEIKNNIYSSFNFFVTYFGWIGIYSWDAFRSFRDAAKVMLDQYARVLNV